MIIVKQLISYSMGGGGLSCFFVLFSGCYVVYYHCGYHYCKYSLPYAAGYHILVLIGWY